MKKRYKALLIFTGITAVIAATNHLLFKLCDWLHNLKHNNQAFLYSGKTYNWRFGDVKYTVSGSGKPLLLVHDIKVGNSSREWEKYVKQLSKNYTVYTIDLLGFGSSDKPRITYSSYLYVSLINDFISECIGESANIIASGSAAGFVAAAYAFKPGLYNKIMMLSPNGPVYISRLFGKLIDLPVYGTFIYSIFSIKNSVCLDSFIKSHKGGIGNKYPISALFSKLLHVDFDRFISGINIPVYVINKGRHVSLLKDMRAFYRVCRGFFS